MKGRMFVVNPETLEETKRDMVVSVFVPGNVGDQWLKTFTDLMADMLQVEIGDYIFLWETASSEGKSKIHGIYRAVSKPYFNPSDTRSPFKIKIETAYECSSAVYEYDVLNCPFIKTPLWTIIGKKVAGKARGTSPLSPREMQALIMLLISHNPDYRYYSFTGEKPISGIPLRIAYDRTGNNATPSSYDSLNPSLLNYLNIYNDVHYEKILETIFNQELADRNCSFFSQLGIDVKKVVWYSNYLPYSIEKSEMDYVIMESEDSLAISKIFLIELQKGRIDSNHIHRCLMYSNWLSETEGLGAKLVIPVLIAHESYDYIDGETTPARIRKAEELNSIINENEDKYCTNPLQIYTYDCQDSKPVMTRKR